VCKYYQGAEDKELENGMKKLFEKVHREKPEASRKVSQHVLDINS
jgi:21S rRNA (uridine2791-2'-O)-methyltransferase